MAHCRAVTHRLLGKPRYLVPCQQSQPFQICVAKYYTCDSSGEAQRLCNGEPHVNAMKDLRSHFSDSTILTTIGIVEILKRWHPNHTVTQTPKSTGVLKLAKAGQAQATLDTNVDYYASRIYKPDLSHAKGMGRLKYRVEFGKYDYRWENQDFQIYVANYWENNLLVNNHYILYPRKQGDVIEGRSQTVDKLITAAAQRLSEVDEETWVYDRGYWGRSHELWKNVQSCKWEDVILNQDLKSQLIGDIEGFFDRKEDYAYFAVPWKRGLIFHGLPGNGKTISIKALMQSLSHRPTPIPTLYVKSLGKSGDHDDIRSIFEKARETSPCLLVLEDIDSLVSDNVKSFFLNEVDGLEANDGILMIGSTNYLDRLDPGISKRPSRFDRKYHFPLPTHTERIQYTNFWRSKLARNPSLNLSPQISTAIANLTEGFSFAYLQEAFVTALLSILQTQREGGAGAGRSGENLGMSGFSKDGHAAVGGDRVWHALKRQIEVLRREMRDSKKSVEDAGRNSVLGDARSGDGGRTGFGL